VIALLLAWESLIVRSHFEYIFSRGKKQIVGYWLSLPFPLTPQTNAENISAKISAISRKQILYVIINIEIEPLPIVDVPLFFRLHLINQLDLPERHHHFNQRLKTSPFSGP